MEPAEGEAHLVKLSPRTECKKPCRESLAVSERETGRRWAPRDVTRAAVEPMRYGTVKVVETTSGSELLVNFAVANSSPCTVGVHCS